MKIDNILIGLAVVIIVCAAALYSVERNKLCNKPENQVEVQVLDKKHYVNEGGYDFVSETYEMDEEIFKLIVSYGGINYATTVREHLYINTEKGDRIMLSKCDLGLI